MQIQEIQEQVKKIVVQNAKLQANALQDSITIMRTAAKTLTTTLHTRITTTGR